MVGIIELARLLGRSRSTIRKKETASAAFRPRDWMLSTPAPSRRRILVAEDSPLNIKLFSALLEARGCEGLAAYDIMMHTRNGKGRPVKLVVYAGATHAFDVAARTRDYRGHHLVYDPQATVDAWRQVRDVLGKLLAR